MQTRISVINFRNNEDLSRNWQQTYLETSREVVKMATIHIQMARTRRSLFPNVTDNTYGFTTITFHGAIVIALDTKQFKSVKISLKHLYFCFRVVNSNYVLIGLRHAVFLSE